MLQYCSVDERFFLIRPQTILEPDHCFWLVLTSLTE